MPTRVHAWLAETVSHGCEVLELDWKGEGEAVNLREERGAGRRHARNVETGRGAACSRSVA